MQGTLKKMTSELKSPVEYFLPVGEELISLNEQIGKKITLHHSGDIYCTHCSRKTKKSFNQGYCYPCFKKLAQCDTCIMKPELCHFSQGTCREPEWAEQFCFQDHFVYLANSSGLKVGITRGTQIPTRWIDQGAIEALPIFKVSNRLQSGLIEQIFAQHIADKTNWRAMLKGDSQEVDLRAERDRLVELCQLELDGVKSQSGEGEIEFLADGESVSITYPVTEYPTKISSFNFDKQAEVSGVLMGIKGQYLILDTGVINIRKFTAYEVEVAL